MGCKRILISSDFYPALRRPNVQVVASGLAKVDGNTLTAKDGTSCEVDAIILATGFHAVDAPIAERLYGADGLSLAQSWNGDMRALRGTTIAGFPNLCMVIGPNTGLGHNSMIYMIESQLNYILDYLATLDRTGAAALDTRPGAQQALVRRHRAADGVHRVDHRRLRELVPQCRGAQPHAVAGIHDRVPPGHPPPGPGRVRTHPAAAGDGPLAGPAPRRHAARRRMAERRVSVAARCHQFAAGTPLAGDLADPDMCVHLWPGWAPGPWRPLATGWPPPGPPLRSRWTSCAPPDVEEVEALAMLSPSARVAPSTAAPAAVPMSGLVILTRFSFRCCPPGTGRDGAG